MSTLAKARSVIFSLLAALCFVSANAALTLPANAGVFVCNETGARVSVAVGYDEGNSSSSHGWYNLSPNDCVNPIVGAIPNYRFYYYAHGNGMEWVDDEEGGYFCTSKAAFDYWLASDCEGHNFREVNTGGQDQYTVRLTESRKDPAQAARDCASTMSEGRDAFIKCWTRNVATSTQRKILDCMDQTSSYASFAICSTRGHLDKDTAAAADCIAKNSGTTSIATCLAKGRLSEQDTRLLNCTVANQGNLAAVGSCALGGQLSSDQRRLVDCVANNRASYTSMAFCAAGPYISQEQRRIANCVVNNGTSYVGMGVCAAGRSLTSEQQAFVQCAVSSAGQPYLFAGCVGTQFTLNELQKCLTQGIGGSGCFGKNNEAVKFVRNAWRDVTRGPGPSNDIVGRDGALITAVRNNVAGPVNDLISGDIGRSPKSVWRQIGLPRIHF
jgi:uncharacterized membrane protein